MTMIYKVLSKARAWHNALFILLLSVAGMTKGYAYSFSAVCPTGQTLYYNITDATKHYVELTSPNMGINGWNGYTKPSGNIMFPETVSYNGIDYVVTSIDNYAMYQCFGMTGDLVIPNSVTNIGVYAFGSCYGFTGSLTIPNSVTTIGIGAFYDCSGFTGSLIIPNSVSTIEAQTFYNCSGFTGNLIIPNSVAIVKSQAFYNCSGFTGGLTIPNSIISIDSRAFQNCSGFTGSLIFPNSITSIGEYAFQNCSGFTGSLTFSSSITSIKQYAFQNCSGLGSLIIPNSVTTIGFCAFCDCVGLSELTIGEGMTSIGGKAFWNCPNLHTVHFNAINCPTMYTTIGSSPNFEYYSVFNSTSSNNGALPITTLTIGDNVQRIPDYAFRNCSNLTSDIFIPNSTVYIGDYAFFGAKSMCLRIGEGVTEIHDYAFWNCPNLMQVQFEAINCTRMYTVINSQYYSVFSNSVFYLSIGDHVTRIPNYAFKNHNYLDGVRFPDAVTHIGSQSFYGCTSMGYIQTYAAIPPIVGTDAFYGVDTDILVTVPCNATNAYSLAAGWSNFNNYYEDFPYWVDVSVNYTSMGSAIVTLWPDCYNNGQTTVSATANPNCSFVNWTCDGEVLSTNPIYSFTPISDMDLEANFMGAPVSVTVSADPANGGIVSGGGTYNQGTNCTVTATANTGYAFVNWTENGTQVSTDASYTFTVMEGRNLEAHFQITYNITATANPTEGGTVTSGGAYVYGQSCTMTAIANAGYTFVNWTEDGNLVSTEATYSFIVTGNRILTANFTIPGGNVPTGANNGLFSVSANRQVWFSQGNLQYQASTHTWRFAENQWDYVGTQHPNAGNAGGTVSGSDNYYVSSTYSGWIDLFAWGTSGINHGAISYMPYSIGTTNTDNEKFFAYGSSSKNLSDAKDDGTMKGQADWGYNAISNGGNTINSWRTLTSGEWYYLLNLRNTSSGVRYAKAIVNNVNGLILLPDSWNIDYFDLNNTNSSEAGFASNIMTTSQWAIIEQHGAVFLPAGGTRPSGGNSIRSVGSGGYYWTNMHGANWTASLILFGNNGSSFPNSERCIGNSIRLVQNVKYAVTAMASPAAGGTIIGGGSYEQGETCTLAAMPNAGYIFTNWTENDTVVSTNASYTFTVNGNRNLVANFTANSQSYTISVSADPSNGGTVAGGGTYAQGATCTVTATASSGYTFTNWTHNGAVVSTECVYGFTVTENAEFVAHFASNTTLHFDYDPYLYPDNMSVTSIVQIEGEEQYSPMLEVGAFCGNECRGTVRPTYMPSVDRYFFFLTIFGENGDEINFRLYDHAIGEESDKVCASTLTFEVNAIVGNALNPFIINFVNANTTQTTNFNNGWNWWSSYIELDSNSLQSLQDGLGSSGVMVKSQNDGYASYLDGFGWYGSLTAINNQSTYQVKTNAACTVELTGNSANPGNHPITLNSGWTWVGYPVNANMSVTEALSGFIPQDNDLLKSQNNGYASYLDGFGWYGSLNTLQPGMGLMYKSNNSSPITLVYPNNGTRTNLKANQTAENNHWQPSLNAYPDNMSVMAVVELDGNELQGENYELAAFANGECRGSARLMYVEPLDRYVAFLTVAGDESAELRFSLFNAETGAECHDAEEALTYETNAVVGSLTEPFTIHFRSTMGVDDFGKVLRIYPNPAKSVIRIEGLEPGSEVRIYNSLGALVKVINANADREVGIGDLANGIYLVRCHNTSLRFVKE